MKKAQEPLTWKPVGRTGEILTGKLIGKGSRSHVYEGLFQDKRCAVKSFLYEGNVQEVEILRGLDHRNIIRIHYTDNQDATLLYIVLDLCQYTVKQYVEQENIREKINLSGIEVLRQITEGLDYLHNGKKVSTIHRDLKPSNILFQFVDREKIWVVKISDFGISKDFTHGKTSTISEMKGSNGYVAPELIPLADGRRGPGKIRKEIDLFSLGVIFFYILSNGSHPFSEDITNVNEKVRDNLPDLSALCEKFADAVSSLILSMLDKDFSKRISASDVKAHHIFWDDDKKIDFLQKTSDILEDRQKHKGLLEELEVHATEVFEDDWKSKLTEGKPEVKRVLEKRGEKNYHSLQDLLRQIRNWISHYHSVQTTKLLKDEIGDFPSGFLEFFTSRFPKLIPCLYDFMRNLKEESPLQKYYKPERQESVPYETILETSETILEKPHHTNQSAVAIDSVAEKMEVDDIHGGALCTSIMETVGPDQTIQIEKSPLHKAPSSHIYNDSQHLVLDASSEMDVPSAETSYDDQGEDLNPLGNQDVFQSKNKRNIQDPLILSEVDEAPDTEVVSSHKKIKRDHETSLPIQINPVKTPVKKEITKELVLRNYQWELAEQALKGKNSLIVAPTGSGKTVVLTQIIKEHFLKSPKGRVMFLVPKTALARQQCSFLRKYLPEFIIEFMIGEDAGNAPVGQKLLHSQVTVLTHQVLVNELRRIESDRYISFSDISLLILDECHSTHGNHPYRVLMNLLLDSNDGTPGHITTQVIGVTASPGVGRAKYRDQVYKNLIRLLANLNVKSAPVTVVENMEDLKKHNNEIKESLLQIETEVEFSKNIQSTILTIEKVITEKILKQMESVRAPPNNKSSIAYDNWVHDVILHAKHHIGNGETARKLIALAEHLAMYHSLLQLKDLMPDALTAVSSMVVLEGEAQEKTWLRTLYERLCEKAINVRTPMIDCLVNIIFEEFQRNPDARCMVFVKRRQTAAYLCDYLANTDKLRNLKPSYMLGRKARQGEDYCGTDNVVVRKEFEDGTSKVLICTSIAEEGLDFVACSLVIMYNYVTGEIGHIQRSGRARAAKSRAIIITSKNSSHAKQEEDNRLCAIATSVAIEDVKKKEEAFPEQLLQEIQDEQERQKVERRNAEAVSQELGGNEEPEKWKVFCAHCKNFLTTGDKLRNLDVHTVIHDEEFYNRTKRDFVEKEKGMNWGDVDYLCNNDVCSIKVAWGMVRNGIRYPTLTIRKILLGHDESGRFVSPGQRKKMPFKILKNVDGNDSSAYERSDKRGPVNDPKPPDEESCIEMLDMIDAWGDD